MEDLMTLKELALDLNSLNDEQRANVQQIVSQIDVGDTQSVIQFGAAAQSEIADFSDALLREVRTKDTGHVGDSLTKLMVEIKGVDVDGLTNLSFLDRLFGGFKNKVLRFIASYDKVGVNLDKIVNELDSAKMTLLKDIKMLDTMYEKNKSYVQTLDNYILAGTLKVKEMEEQVLPQLKQTAESSADPIDAQRYNDTNQLVNRFEKKVHDLKLSRMVAIQSAPQIRLIQNNNNVLVEKIQSSIMNTVPLWKNQIIIAISLLRQEGALKIQEEVTNVTNDLLKKNSEMLKDQSLRTAEANERGIVEIDTLQKVHHDLINTLEETIRIQQNGRTKRAEVERELQNLETDLKQKLISIT